MSNKTYPDITTLIRQPDGTFQTSKEGVARSMETYIGPYNLCLTSPLFQIDTPHPDFPSLLVYDRKAVRKKGTTMTGEPIGRVDVEYRGLDPAFAENGTLLPPPVYTLERSTSQEPIDTHTKFKTVLGGESNATSINGAKFEKDTEIFIGFSADSQYAGVSSYLSAGSTWTKTYLSYTRLSGNEMSKVGFIDAPEGDEPTPPGDYNWLYIGASYTKEGGIYRIQKSWLLSSKGKWPQEIYTP